MAFVQKQLPNLFLSISPLRICTDDDCKVKPPPPARALLEEKKKSVKCFTYLLEKKSLFIHNVSV